MKKSKPYVDDGHTIYSMDGIDEMQHGTRDKKCVGLNRKEKWTAIKAALAVYLPRFLGIVACFAVVAFLLYFWLMY